MPTDLASLVAREFYMKEEQAAAVLSLLDAGHTAPFVLRYRKDQTGAITEERLRQVKARVKALRHLEERRQAIRQTIQAAGKLTEEMAYLVDSARTLHRLEDVYLPFRPKRRTLGTTARERGLEGLADALLAGLPADQTPEAKAAEWINPDKGVATVEEALAGACHILAERLAEHMRVRERCRRFIWRTGRLTSRRGPRADHEAKDFRDYFEFSEALERIPAHRVLALARGESKHALKVLIDVDLEQLQQEAWSAWMEGGHPQADFLRRAVQDGVQRLLLPSLAREIRTELVEQAEARAIEVAARNLDRLLMRRPTRVRRLMAIAPGYRAGCQLAVLDEAGRVLDRLLVMPHQPHNKRDEAVAAIVDLCRKHEVSCFAIGNGTASRETEELISQVIAEHLPEGSYTVVDESGADVYAASRTGREELPELTDLEREAVSIGRRLLDPLAELVKVEPAHVVASLHHQPVNARRLRERLQGAVQSCVNRVGVDLNTAGVSLLRHVAGLDANLARSVVEHRAKTGGFRSRAQLREVPGITEEVFVQAAGFVRVSGGDNPLDTARIHPESYPVCEKLLAQFGITVAEWAQGDGAGRLHEALSRADVTALAGQLGVGVHTLRDILEELKTPWRDPRESLPPPVFRKSLLTLDSLTPGMTVEGVVRKVVDFGAFVDIGLDEDGLVHISRMADRFVDTPYDVVEVGEVRPVWVVEVDRQRGRVALSLRAPVAPAPPSGRPARAQASAAPAPEERPAAPAKARPAQARPREPKVVRAKKRPVREKPSPAPRGASKPASVNSTPVGPDRLTYRPFAELAKQWQDRQQDQTRPKKRQDQAAGSSAPAGASTAEAPAEPAEQPVSTVTPEAPPSTDGEAAGPVPGPTPPSSPPTPA